MHRPLYKYLQTGFYVLFLIASITIPDSGVVAQELERYTFRSNHMGSQFTIILYAENKEKAERVSTAAFNRIEEINQIMSDYIPESELNTLSRSSGSGDLIPVSEPLFDVLQISKEISEETGGMFDVTMGPLTRAWRMTRMMPEPVMPDQKELDELLSRVGSQYMHLDESNRTVLLEKEGMRLDLGGIAKGYAAEKAVQLMRDKGVPISLLDAGGDITLGDPPPGRDHWEVAVPMKRGENERGHIRMGLTGKSVATSGDMFQFVEINGTRYSHILVPTTGLGATRQLQSTVISTSGMHADAYASALTLMEPEEAIKWINSLDDTEAVIYMNQTDGVQEWKSAGFNQYLLDE